MTGMRFQMSHKGGTEFLEGFTSRLHIRCLRHGLSLLRRFVGQPLNAVSGFGDGSGMMRHMLYRVFGERCLDRYKVIQYFRVVTFFGSLTGGEQCEQGREDDPLRKK